MNGMEMRAVRKKIAMTQHELASRLCVSRKTIIGWETSDHELDPGVVLQVREVAGEIRLIENSFLVEPTPDGSYAVIHRRMRQVPRAFALAYFHGETMLYGIFKRRDHAYRWCAALQNTADPRNTRKLIKRRALDAATVNTPGETAKA